MKWFYALRIGIWETDPKGLGESQFKAYSKKVDHTEMKYLPTEKITYNSSLGRDEIIKRLSDIINKERVSFSSQCGAFRISEQGKSYIGKCDTNSFTINRITGYCNPFLPQVNGTVEDISGGTKIKVRMRLHLLVKLLLLILYGFIGFVLIRIILISAPAKVSFIDLLKIELIMGTFVLAQYLLTMGCFKAESSKAKNDLKNLFEADPIDD